MNVPGPVRYDYAFPLAIDPASRQALRVGYAQHVAQMIRQFLLTTPGERVCLPDFGGGLRRLVFSPKNAGQQSLQSTTELLIRQGLDKYLGQHIEVLKVTVRDAAEIDDGAIEVFLEYRLLETQTTGTLTLQIR
jgi:uncharacterized protein